MKRLLPIVLTGAAAILCAQFKDDRAFPAHRVIGNVFYVGSKDLASYLITTPEGSILINSSFERTVPLIRSSVESLGFKFSDIKILLDSHAHGDHVAGNAMVKELTGAKVMVMQGDENVVESGGGGDPFYSEQYKPCKVDRVLRDGDTVTLGGTTLTAHLTPGHTRGCTTWTLKAAGKDVVIVGSPNVNAGYILVNNAKYPDIARDYQHTFDVLKGLHCDVFLGAHGNYYGMEEKYARMKADPKVNPFIDPEGYRKYVENREKAFHDELQRQGKP